MALSCNSKGLDQLSLKMSPEELSSAGWGFQDWGSSNRLSHHPWRYLIQVWVGHLRAWFSSGLGIATLKVGLNDPRGLFQPKCSMIAVYHHFQLPCFWLLCFFSLVCLQFINTAFQAQPNLRIKQQTPTLLIYTSDTLAWKHLKSLPTYYALGCYCTWLVADTSWPWIACMGAGNGWCQPWSRRLLQGCAISLQADTWCHADPCHTTGWHDTPASPYCKQRGKLRLRLPKVFSLTHLQTQGWKN